MFGLMLVWVYLIDVVWLFIFDIGLVLVVVGVVWVVLCVL